MLMPSIFGENLFDDFMDFPFDDKWEKKLNKEFFGKKNPLYGKNASRLMKTDVRETDNSYELDVDLPGFKKDEIQVELENGYLTISAEKGLDKAIAGHRFRIHHNSKCISWLPLSSRVPFPLLFPHSLSLFSPQ